MTVSYTFSPPIHPDFGMNRKFKPKTLMANFGDGYSQRAADGINNNAVVLAATWTNLTATEKDYIMGFFESRKGVDSFYYTYVDETVAKVYICQEWDYTHNDAGSYSATATLQQVYDI